MSKVTYQWLISENELSDSFVTSVIGRQLPETFATLLWQRGIRDEEALENFLHPSLEKLHDPFLFYDMDRAIERVQQAIIENQKILIYGDYDADGITSTTILKEALDFLGADVEFYLPNRFADGYGPNQRVYSEKINEGVQLIITVDNGVSGHEAIDYANSVGVDVIVTDHHELPEQLPNAYAIIHPRHPKGHYPFKELAGVGVAFKFVCALLDELVVESLDLVAIGTIADMVSLTDENRILVAFGLQAIRQTERMGLQELIRVSQVVPEELDDKSVGFSLAPRLNALGRLSDATIAVELLTTFDEQKAKTLAQEIDQKNTERKQIVADVFAEASQKINVDNQIHVIVGENWHEGVLGIVAGRIMQQTGKPTIVLTKLVNGVAKGSGRSIESFDLFQTLLPLKELFLSFGGHHSAVGLSIEQNQIDTLQQSLNDYVLTRGIHFTGLPLRIDGTLKIEEATVPFIKSLQTLAPFGMDNRYPKFLFSEIKATDNRLIGAEKNHLKGQLSDGSASLPYIAFQFGSYLTDFSSDNLSIVGELTLNSWNNHVTPQLMVDDYLIKGSQVFDFRSKRQSLPPLNVRESIFISFTEKKIGDQKFQAETIHVRNEEDIAQLKQKSYKEVIYLDCPSDVKLVKKVAQQFKNAHHYLVFEATDDAYLDGLGTREQYKKMYQVIKQQQTLDIRYKLDELANYLQIPKKLLIFMIQVFFDLKFVTINDGILGYVEDVVPTQLEASTIYQQRKQRIDSEMFLQLSDIADLKDWFFS